MYINFCLTFCIVLFFFKCKKYLPWSWKRKLWDGSIFIPIQMWVSALEDARCFKHCQTYGRAAAQGAELMAPHAFHLKIWTTIQSKWILSSWSEPHSVCVERLERTLRCPYFITMTHSAAIIPARYSTMLFLACFFSFSCNFSSAMHKTQWLSRRSC